MNASLKEVARRVNWYTDPDRLLNRKDLFLSQVMARGLAEDVIAVQQQYTEEDFKQAYLSAPPGLFTRRAWAYWGLVLLGDPHYPIPERFPGAARFDWRKGVMDGKSE